MNRRGLWAACVVLILLVGAGVLTVGAGYAKDEDDAGAKCSEATLHGTYLVAHDGFDISGNEKVPFAVAGQEVYDGNGKVDAVYTGNFGGMVDRRFEAQGTYTVNPNCTGANTLKTDGEPVNADLFIAPDGSMFTFVQTEPPELVASGLNLRGTAKRVAQ
jgi:hypothetical protein